MFVLKPENDQNWQKSAGQTKLVGQLPHQLYKKLHPLYDLDLGTWLTIPVHTMMTEGSLKCGASNLP